MIQNTQNQRSQKNGGEKKKSKNRCHEQKTISNMVDTNRIISAVTLNVKSLTAPVKSQRFPGWIKKSKIQ